MTMPAVALPVRERIVTTAWIERVLAFRAPYLEDKLLKEQIAGDRQEARALFQEVKKYLMIAHCDSGRLHPLFSLRVDAAWHEFVLFTAEYTRFCQEHFETYLQHDPANAPREPVPAPHLVSGEHDANASAMREASYDDFCSMYRTFFGTSLPRIWQDELFVGIDVRVRNDHVASSSVRVCDGKAELLRDGELVLARVDVRAEDALRFMATHPSFYPRELPGRLRDEDRVALCRALVGSRALRVSA
jgi:hypothetical protein